jgi:hypothetical protein
MIALGEAVSVEKRICSIYLQIIHTYVAGRSLFPNKEQHPLRQPPLRSSNVEVVWQAQAQCDPESCIADLETVWESEKRPGYSEHLYDLSALLDKVIIYHAKEENISEEMIAKHARLEQKTADLQHFLFTLFALYDIIADIGEPEAINSSARLIKLIDKVKPVSNQSMAYHHLIDSFFNQY